MESHETNDTAGGVTPAQCGTGSPDVGCPCDRAENADSSANSASVAVAASLNADAVSNVNSKPFASSHGHANSTVDLAQPTTGLPVPHALEVHEIALLFPPMSEKEFEALVADIKEHGQREAIWTYLGRIIDGRHRWLACKRLGITPLTREWDGVGSLLEFVITLNLRRRHLKETQRAMIAARMMPQFEEDARKRQGWACTTGSLRNNCYEGQNVTEQKKSHEGRAADDVGKLLNVSWMSVHRARTVLEKGIPALVEAVDLGKLAVSTAASLAERPQKEQEDLLKLSRRELAKALRPTPLSPLDSGPASAASLGGEGNRAMTETPEQQEADAALLRRFVAGYAKLTKNEQGFRLEFTDNCLDELCKAVENRAHFLELLQRGVWMVWKKGA